jgi:hypothetical protein
MRLNLTQVHAAFISWDSSVIVVSDYRLDDWDSIPGRDKAFFL